MRKIIRPIASEDIKTDLSNNKYSTAIIYDLLGDMSYNACYICGRVIIDPEIEHRFAKSNLPHLEFVWSNLLYSCGKCNKDKYLALDRHKKTPLDPTYNVINSERSLIYTIDELKVGDEHLNVTVNESYFTQVRESNNVYNLDYYHEEATNTAVLINRVFGNETERSRHIINNLNGDLDEKMSNFYKLVLEYTKNYRRIHTDQDYKDDFSNRMILEINGKSNYIGIKRSYLRNEYDDDYLTQLIVI